MADDIFSQAGFTLPTVAPAAPASAAPPGASSPSMFESAGFTLPNSKAYEPPADSEYPVPGVDRGTHGQPAKSTLQQIRESIDPATLLATGAKNTVHDTLENAVASKDVAVHGLKDIKNRNYLPTTPSFDPSTWSPGGLLKTAGGALGVASSPITGAANALVGTPVTALTGNPEIGDRASFVASSAVPIGGAGKAAVAAAPATKAVNKLVDAVGAENVPELVAGLRANPRMTVADLSDPVRLTTQGLMAGGTPDVQQFISGAVRDRAGTRLQAANTAYTDAMGPAPDVSKMVEGLKQRARDAGQQAIQPALANAKPVDVSPVIQAIDAKLKPGLTALMGDTKLPLSNVDQELLRFKSQLTDGENQVFDPNKLHQIQSQVGDQAYQLSKSADPKDRMLGGQLRNMNEKLIDQIDDASGGAYRPARAQFKDAKDISEAFESGFDTLKNRSGLNGALEDSPQAFNEWMKDATPEEVVARRLGTRADIDQKINGVKNGALAGQNITAIPYNQQKLTSLFGDKEAGRLIQVMQDAKREADTNAAIFQGSKTAETTAAADRIKVRKIGGGNPLQTYALPAIGEGLNYITNGSIIPGAGAALAGATMLAHRGIQKLGQMHDVAQNYAFAKNALATGPAREDTINALLAHPQVTRELKKRANALTTP